jgi:hypothetical protein
LSLRCASLAFRTAVEESANECLCVAALKLHIIIIIIIIIVIACSEFADKAELIAGNKTTAK